MKIRRGEINLHVRDLERATRFYQEALGFSVCDPGETNWRKLANGETTLTLFRAENPRMTQDLRVDDFDTAVRRLEQAGATITKKGGLGRGSLRFLR